MKAELYVRSLVPHGAFAPQEAVVERLLDLESEGRLDLSLTVWGDQIATDSAAARTEAGRTLLRSVRAFRSWEDESGYAAEPFFSDVRRTSLVDASYDAIVPPNLCLALYREGTVAGVFPCSDRETCYTVEDAVEAMAGTKEIPPVTAALDGDDADADDSFLGDELRTYASPVVLDE